MTIPSQHTRDLMHFYMVPWGRLELPSLSAVASKTTVYTIPPPGQSYILLITLYSVCKGDMLAVPAGNDPALHA